MDKGQAAFEFLSYFSFFLLVFIVIFAYMGSEQANEVRVRQFEISKEITDSFADEINIAVGIGDGYQRNITFPTKILGQTDYALIFKRGFVEVEWTNNLQYLFSSALDKNDFATSLSNYNYRSGTDLKLSLDDADLGYLQLNNSEIFEGEYIVKHVGNSLNIYDGQDNFVYFSPLSTENLTSSAIAGTPDGGYQVDVSKGYLELNNTKGVIYIAQ